MTPAGRGKERADDAEEDWPAAHVAVPLELWIRPA